MPDTTDLEQCRTCGAVYMSSGRLKHEQWHRSGIERDVKNAEHFNRKMKRAQ